MLLKSCWVDGDQLKTCILQSSPAFGAKKHMTFIKWLYEGLADRKIASAKLDTGPGNEISCLAPVAARISSTLV
jgi:hypothetical protein